MSSSANSLDSGSGHPDQGHYPSSQRPHDKPVDNYHPGYVPTQYQRAPGAMPVNGSGQYYQNAHQVPPGNGIPPVMQDPHQVHPQMLVYYPQAPPQFYPPGSRMAQQAIPPQQQPSPVSGNGQQNGVPNGVPNVAVIPPHGGTPVNPKKRTLPAGPGANLSRTSSTYPRKRALTACDTCRMKKVKCDNVRPRCGACLKNGNVNCHYRTDDQNDYSSFDPASLNILSKLDIILEDLKLIKGKKELVSDDEDEYEEEPKKRRYVSKNNEFHFDKCFWDMSMTSVMDWRFFKNVTEKSDEDIDAVSVSILQDLNDQGKNYYKAITLQDRVKQTEMVEKLILHEFSNLMNSFFVNFHTKIPVLNILELVESLEIYSLLKKYDPLLTFMKILERHDPAIDDKNEVPNYFLEALKNAGLEDNNYRRQSYHTFCNSIPLFLVICACGILVTPIQLDNIGNFLSSLEEKSSMEIGPLAKSTHMDDLHTKDRCSLSQFVLKYCQVISTIFPYTLQENSLTVVEYYIMMNQYHLSLMDPMKAYRYIVRACHSMIYFLEMRKIKRKGSGPDTYDFSADRDKKEVIDRLFWTCLKLESEIRVELSPHVPLSGITQVTPPSSFPKIPDPVSNTDGNHSAESIKLTNLYDDKHAWYYFLTEVAVRKVDNSMFDELYSHEGMLNKQWDLPEFPQVVLHSFIKYLNQYNGIINSLSPKIRNFVLQEVNVEQIYKSMKKKSDKKKLNIKEENDIFGTLDEFLIDDDLLLRAQSDAIMFIKTRILTSKIFLFRPIIYLFLEDKIPFEEILEAAMLVVPNSLNQNARAEEDLGLFLNEPIESPSFSPGSMNTGEYKGEGSVTGTLKSSTDESESQMGIDYFNLINAPLLYQKQNPDEDFSNLIEYYSDTNKDEGGFVLKDVKACRIQILKVFMQSVISLPKMDIPKLGAHRHPGLWYYLRNMLIGNIYMFLLFKKIQQVLCMMTRNKTAASMENQDMAGVVQALNLVISKESLRLQLEHSQVVYNYWKAESKDCQIYHDVIQSCLDHIDA